MIKVTKKDFVNVDKIKEYIEEHHYSKVKFCLMTAITPKLLEKILRGERGYDAFYLWTIAVVMGVPLDEIFVKHS